MTRPNDLSRPVTLSRSQRRRDIMKKDQNTQLSNLYMIISRYIILGEP